MREEERRPVPPPPPPPPPEPEKKKRRRKKRHPVRTFCILLIVILILGALSVYLLTDWDLGVTQGLDLLDKREVVPAVLENHGQPPRETAPAGTPVVSPPEETESEIVIRVAENTITVGGETVADAEALREYLENVNTDESAYRLIDAHAVQQTYTEVKAVLDRLALHYAEGSEN